ncbi:hypothetical protein SAY87_024473 [Trapa incisa]|uniref:Uncharacterized protein n=1 Tax=Trapa incisa TaxID=236973 RepID=A0AAN7G998_9MYRT|nr:hypothetical protein SAY87_024473 [Trapa incisa]
MVAASKLVHGLKLSSVVPAKIAGDNRARELTGLDLAVKLHYLRGVYFFHSTAEDVPLRIESLKEPMFRWLETSYPAAGRIRRAEGRASGGGGRPFVKCNDGGVRIVEARSEKTVDEWLAMEDHANIDGKVLAYDQVLGPDLGFTPLVFVQFTWFKCGGMSVGLSWAHVLGDLFSASSFMNMWGRVMAGHASPSPNSTIDGAAPTSRPPRSTAIVVSSLRQVEPVGDHWITTSNRTTMRTHTFHVTSHRVCGVLPPNGNCPSCFYVLSALLWKCISKIRGVDWPRAVTVVCSGSSYDRCYLPGNHMTVGTVEAGDSPVSVSDVAELASWMEKHTVSENQRIEEMAGRDGSGKPSDYILYGSNLTFVDLEYADIYGLELKGQKPAYASYTIHGVGDEGVILILPCKGVAGVGKRGMNGWTITVTLPGNEGLELEKEIK